MTARCEDPVMLNQWHPLSSLAEIDPGKVHRTVLLQEPLAFAMDANGDLHVWRATAADRDGRTFEPDPAWRTVAMRRSHGYLWACLGSRAPETLFSFDEFYEDDRRTVPTGVFGVSVSPGRAVENFLDMGHFPYVHTGILGEEPHTEVKEYDVEVSEERDEVLATECRFFQPQAALASQGGADVDYIYRVPHINCALLYKSCPNDETRKDVVYLFIQPLGPDLIRAHTGMCVLDDENSYEGIRLFQQTIFGQDKPILENQFPKRLPLDPRAETPIRADKSAIAYRRWLSSKGLTYGVIPAAA